MCSVSYSSAATGEDQIRGFRDVNANNTFDVGEDNQLVFKNWVPVGFAPSQVRLDMEEEGVNAGNHNPDAVGQGGDCITFNSTAFANNVGRNHRVCAQAQDQLGNVAPAPITAGERLAPEPVAMRRGSARIVGVVTGEVGTGKTTLLYKTMRSLKATTHPVFLCYEQLAYAELLRHLSRELGLPTDGQDRLAIATRLRDYLIAQQKKGHIVALLIDEAQNLSDDMFEGIRFLLNFETEKQKLVQIVLSGQPELAIRLDQPSLRHLKQRMVFHCRLTPLKKEEVGRYIDFRLEKAGYERRHLFAPDAVARVASYSEGIPRLINIVCDNALLLAFALSKKQVSKEMIDEVARDLGLKECSQADGQSSPRAATEDETGLVEAKADIEQETKFAEGEPWNPDLAGRTELLGPKPQRARRQKGGPGPMSIAACVILIAFAGAAGVLSSQPTRDYIRDVLQQAPAAEGETNFETNSVTNSSGESQIAVPSAEGLAATHTKPDEPTSERAKPQVITPKVEQPKVQERQAKTEGKEREVVTGQFEVIGPFSFVRRTPRADADIIATLQPATRQIIVADIHKVQTSCGFGVPLYEYTGERDHALKWHRSHPPFHAGYYN